LFPTFRDIVSLPSSRFKMKKKILIVEHGSNTIYRNINKTTRLHGATSEKSEDVSYNAVKV
jgi:hypothetical protein